MIYSQLDCILFRRPQVVSSRGSVSLLPANGDFGRPHIGTSSCRDRGYVHWASINTLMPGEWLITSPGIISLYTTHSILVLRLNGLYRSKKVAYTLATLLGLAFAVEVYILLMFALNSYELDINFNIGRICVVSDTSKVAFVW